MRTESIAEIAIDGSGRLLVKPATQEFESIYRAAMQVNVES
jgi:hypothetical protein